MQIVIDIPEDVYENIKKENTIKNHLNKVDWGVRNGIPLPKGRGKLICSPTIEEIEKTIGGKNDFASCIRESVKAVFDNAQTVIPEYNKEKKLSENCICRLKKGEEIDIGYGAWTALKMSRQDTDGDIRISAYGDGRADYTPKYCPECGRRINMEDAE